MLQFSICHGWLNFFSRKLDGVCKHKDTAWPPGTKHYVGSLGARLRDQRPGGLLVLLLGFHLVSFPYFTQSAVAQLPLSPSSESIFRSFHYRKSLALFSGLVRRGNISFSLLVHLWIRTSKCIFVSQGQGTLHSPPRLRFIIDHLTRVQEREAHSLQCGCGSALHIVGGFRGTFAWPPKTGAWVPPLRSCVHRCPCCRHLDHKCLFP